MDKFLNVSNLFWRTFKFMARKGMVNWMPDKFYLSLMFRAVTGKRLNLHEPKYFNEKLQWLKLYDHNPLYTIMADKVKVKEYVASKIGKQYIIPTLGVWKNVDEVDFDSLPSRFVIKCNHNSGKGMYVCRDKNKMDVSKVHMELRQGLKENYYIHNREWPYKDIPRRIIAEQYMEDKTSKNIEDDKLSKVGNLRDYKFYCFNGVPKLCQVISDRAIDEKIDFYNMEWKRLVGLVGLVGLNNKVHNSNQNIPCPLSFDEMKRCASILSHDIPFSRIDFYDIDGHAYFGEITFFPAGGFGFFKPDEWNKITGDWLQLPLKYTR